jgi:hypothetical protein
MYILLILPSLSSSSANLTLVPDPCRRRSTSFQGQHTIGTITVISRRHLPDIPTELVIEFQPIRQTEFPHTNAPRTIRINLTGQNAGLGTITRASYTQPDGIVIPEATIEICTDAIPSAQYDQLNSNGRRVYQLIGSGLAQISAVSASNMYYDIRNLPIIRAYERHGNAMEGGQFEVELNRLIRTLR